uniref:Uncharacterized protein n=1 Tax=Arundo donax TaxID=35708 RepID=A0A0A8YVP6_ARUDO
MFKILYNTHLIFCTRIVYIWERGII